MKRLSTRLAVLLLLLFAAATGGYAQNATVASWNILGFNPIPPSRVKIIARAIHNMKPEVIALIEVNPDSVVQDIVDELATGHGDDYEFFFYEQTATQNIAILFKNGVQVLNDELIPGSDDNQSGLRKALAAEMRIRNFDFIFIAVHSKSARGAAERATRTRQANAIANYIRNKTAGSEKDVIVVGDYNMIPGDDNENFSALSPGPASNEFLRFVSSEVLAGQRSHISRCSPTIRGNLLDGYAISRTHTGEYRTGSLRIIPFTDPVFRTASGVQPDCVRYTGFISDHLPLVARFRTASDDD